MNKRNQVTLFLILLLIFSTFVALPHHHENAADDHDCPICVASHHLPATSQSAVAFDSVPCFTETIFAASSPVFTDNLFSFSLNNRAPPA